MRAGIESVVPSGHEEVYDTWHLSPAVRMGDLVVCSGVIGTRPDGTVPVDLAEEIDQAFDNAASVLAVAGGSLSDIADLITFHRDLAAEVPVFMQVRDRRLGAPWPSWTAVGVTQVGGGLPGVRIEIRILAHCPRRD